MVAAGKMGGGLDCEALPKVFPTLGGSLPEDKEEPSRRMQRTVHCSLLMCNTRPCSSALSNRNCHAVSRISQWQMVRGEEEVYM